MRSASSDGAPQLAVVVLNWNGVDDTLACLSSLRESSVVPYSVVVDNGSSDDSVERIRASGLADELLETGANLGYAGGNNVGVERALAAGAAVIAVLNNDTVVHRNAFASLLEQLPPSELRAVSPDVRYLDRPEESWFAGGTIERGWTRHLQAGELVGAGPLRPSEWLSGCCIVARREVWETVGLFDERFFVFFEDSDWSMRAIRQDVELYVAPESVIEHRVSRTFAGSAPFSLLGGYYFVRNGLRFDARYFRGALPGFVWRWLVRPTPRLIREHRLAELAFLWLGALASVAGTTGRAAPVVERLAGRFAGGAR